jgi:hypothetical protein
MVTRGYGKFSRGGHIQKHKGNLFAGLEVTFHDVNLRQLDNVEILNVKLLNIELSNVKLPNIESYRISKVNKCKNSARIIPILINPPI